MNFGAELVGEREVDLRFEQFPERAKDALARRMRGLTQTLLDRVQGAEPERTGRLRTETVARVSIGRTRVRGVVSVKGEDRADWGKAGALEYGAPGIAAVAAHSQTLTHVFRRLIAPTLVLVEAYTRRPNIAARRYLRGPLDAMRSEVFDELRAALAEAAG